MNWNRIEGNWEQFKGKVQQQWGKLTNDDIDAINGRSEQLAGRLQERYGIEQDEAKRQGFPELWLPKAILVTRAIPVLGNGKIDYGGTRELAITMRPLL